MTKGRVVGVVVATLLATGGLAACSSAEESYCSALREDEPRLQKLSRSAAEPGSDALVKSVDILAELGEKAPDDIEDEWGTLVSSLEGLVAAVRASGADFPAFASGKAPEGVTEGQLKAVQQAAEELTDTRVQQAGASIEQHARDVCKVDLGGGLAGPTG